MYCVPCDHLFYCACFIKTFIVVLTQIKRDKFIACPVLLFIPFAEPHPAKQIIFDNELMI